MQSNIYQRDFLGNSSLTLAGIGLTSETGWSPDKSAENKCDNIRNILGPSRVFLAFCPVVPGFPPNVWFTIGGQCKRVKRTVQDRLKNVLCHL